MHTVFSLQSYIFQPYAIAHVVVSIALLLLGFFVYLQRRKAVSHLAYLFVCLSAAVWLMGDALIMSTLAHDAALFWAKFVYVGITFIPPSMYFFSSTWLNLYKKNNRLILLNYVTGLLFVLLIFFTDKIIHGYQKHFFGNFSTLGPWSAFYLAYFFIIPSAFFFDLGKNYFIEANPVRKIQIKNVLMAFCIAFIGSAEFLPTFGINVYPIGAFTIFLYTIIIANIIIRYKFMNIETVVHKTIAWSLASLAIAAPFVLGFFLIKPWFLTLNAPVAFIFLLFYSIFSVSIFNVIQPKVDKFFQRGRFNLESALENFSNELVKLKGVGELTKRIRETIINTLYAEDVSMFVLDEKAKKMSLAAASGHAANKFPEMPLENKFLQWLASQNQIINLEFIDVDPALEKIKSKAQEYFKQMEGTELCIPLVLNGSLLGIINAGRKKNLKTYGPLDYYFLRQIKNQSVIALSNSLLYQNIEEKVKERTKELVEVQKQLVQAEKLATMGTLAGGVAHEINNPLTAILTNVQMLLATGEPDKESLEMIEEATKRCKTIVQKLMTYAKKPLQSSIVSKINLLEVINNSISFLKFQLEQENISIVLKASENVYLVKGNNNELEQVITNLVLNAKDAIKKIKKKGVIEITVSGNDDKVKLEVKDEGEGIPKEIINRIFDPFFTTKEVGKGLGLGLSICQSVIEKHHGSISVQSEVKKGSLFTIQLPRINEKSMANSSSA